MTDAIQILVIILVANGAPVLASYVFDHKASLPVDFGKVFSNGKPVFGPAKTWRGLFASLVLTSLSSWLLLGNLTIGLVVAVLAMTGDLIASFTKRRLGLPASSRAIFIDQVPESLLPALGVRVYVSLDLIDIIVIVSGFIMLEVLLSKLFYRLGIRKHPY